MIAKFVWVMMFVWGRALVPGNFKKSTYERDARIREA